MALYYDILSKKMEKPIKRKRKKKTQPQPEEEEEEIPRVEVY